MSNSFRTGLITLALFFLTVGCDPGFKRVPSDDNTGRDPENEYVGTGKGEWLFDQHCQRCHTVSEPSFGLIGKGLYRPFKAKTLKRLTTFVRKSDSLHVIGDTAVLRMYGQWDGYARHAFRLAPKQIEYIRAYLFWVIDSTDCIYTNP